MPTSDKPRRQIKYVLAGTDVDGPGTQSVRWSESEDNPMSAGFVPLTQRGERGIARWWALHARKNRRQVHGVF